MAKKYGTRDISKLTRKKIFFDSDVLLYLFWPTLDEYFEHVYAHYFKCLKRQRNIFFVDYEVLSELINRVLRIEHKKFKSALKFKDFRKSPEGKAVLTDINIIVKNDILTQFDVVGKTFSKTEIENLLKVDELDLVDKAIVTLCKENRFILLTNDLGFKNTNVNVLSLRTYK